MARNTIFEIEEVFDIDAQGWFVMARLLSGPPPSGHGAGHLGGVQVLGGTIPRKLDKEGVIRTDVWIFRLENADDSGKLGRGQTVHWSAQGVEDTP